MDWLNGIKVAVVVTGGLLCGFVALIASAALALWLGAPDFVAAIVGVSAMAGVTVGRWSAA